MDTIRFRERARIFEGVQLTEENMQEVAKWCDGEVRSFNGKWFLKIVDTNNDLVVNPGSWVMVDPNGRYTMVDENMLEVTFEVIDVPVTFRAEDEQDRDSELDIPADEVGQEAPSEALEGPSERLSHPKPGNLRNNR